MLYVCDLEILGVEFAMYALFSRPVDVKVFYVTLGQALRKLVISQSFQVALSFLHGGEYIVNITRVLK